MRREDHRRVGFGDLVELFHKNGAFALECVHHMTVVDDLMALVDGCAEFLQGQLDNLDRPVDAGAKAAGSCEQDLKRWSAWGGMSHGEGGAGAQVFVWGSRHLPWRSAVANARLDSPDNGQLVPLGPDGVGNKGPQETGQVFGQGRRDAIGT